MRLQKNIKKLLTICFLLAVILSKAQTSQNPFWTTPPYFTQVQPSFILSQTIPNYAFPGSTLLYSSNPARASYYKSYYAHNMMADAAGNPLFYIMDGNVFDQNGNQLNNGATTNDFRLNWAKYDTSKYSAGVWTPQDWGIFETITGFSEVCLVRNPQNCLQYYIFTAGAIMDNGSGPNTNICGTGWNNFGTSGGVGGIYRFFSNYFYPFYAMIDLSQTSHYTGTPGVLKRFAYDNYACGSSTTHKDSFNTVPLFPLLYSKVTPVKQFAAHYAATDVIGSGSSAYNLLFYSDGYKCFCIKVDGTVPLTTANVLSKDSLTTASQTAQCRSEMEVVKLSGGNYRVAWPYMNSSTGAACIHVQDYTSAGAKVAGTSGDIALTPSGAATPYIHGMEFTTDGSKLYFTHETTTGYSGYIYYVTIGTWGTLNTVGTPPSIPDLQYSQIELNYQSTTPFFYLADSTNFVSISMTNTWNSTAATFPTTPYYYKSDLNGEGQGFINSPSHTAPVFPTYLLPDQIDGGAYPGQTSMTAACCILYNSYDKNTYKSGQASPAGWGSTTQTWRGNSNPLNNGAGSTVNIEKELRVAAGFTVTIDSMTINFTPEARLIIENGATGKNGGSLILNNCTLKVDNRCITDMWPGVQVWGTPANSHNFSSQGSISLNNSQIQDAYTAVLLGFNSSWASAITPDPGLPATGSGCFSLGTGSYIGGGGIITTQSTTFLNNQTGLAMFTYTANPSPNNDVITESTFLVNAALLASGVTPAYGIYVINNFNTTGLYVVGSSFSDTHYLNTDYGIYALNSYFNVGNFYGNNPRSTFTNMAYGIYATNTGGSAATMSCQNSTLTNNNVGIYLGHVNNAIVENDTFKIRRIAFSNSSGLFIDNSTGFYVQDNFFNQNNTATSSKPYGIVVNNTGSNSNGIFRNTFANLYKGSQAQYRNYYKPALGQHINDIGLMYLCNTFSVSTITAGDIYVPQTGSGNNVGGTYTGSDSAGVAFGQGAGGAATGGDRPTADNQFSHTSGGKDFWIEGGKSFPSNYFYWASSTANCGVTSSAYMPVTTNSVYVYCYTVTTTPNCSTGGNGHARAIYVDPITQAKQDAATYKHLYDSLNTLIDGGNTNDLFNLVSGNNNSSAVHNSLTNAAPYISDEVLKAYINSNYPASDISQLLVACSPLSDEVNHVVTKSNLSAGLKTQIITLQTGTSKMDNLYAGIRSSCTARQLSLDKAIRLLIRTSTSDSIAMANALLKEKAMELPARAQVETALDIHDSAMAVTALAQVANVEGQSNFVKLHTILLQNMGKTPEQIMQDQSIVSQMQAMDKDSSDRLTYYKANALLRTVGLSDYQPYYQENDIKSNINNAGKKANASTQSIIVSESSLYNQPNPFKESTVIKAVIVEKTQNAYMVITDILGSEVARYTLVQGENEITFKADGVQQQILFTTLIIDGIKIKTNKMVLIK